MIRAFLTVCLLAHISLGAPQRGVQLGGPGGPRPVTYGSPGPTSPPNFGPSYTQQINFGQAQADASGQNRGRAPGAYQSSQPILLQQGNPTGAPQIFGGFQSSTPFPGRQQIVNLRSSGSPTAAPAADDEEYEEYEDEEEAPRQSPTPRPAQIQRQSVRGSPQQFGGPSRLVVPQAQPQAQAPVRQRQPQPTAAPQRYTYPAPNSQQHQPLEPQSTRGQSLGSQAQHRAAPATPYGLDGKRTRLTTPSPVQTVNRYMKQNDDGSITWGYENEDGTFKEENIGKDCVVRGKYGYVDPDGQKREYEYQSGNPCDPNKKDQEEEDELPEGPGPQQQLAGVINARPRPVQQQQRRPIPQQQQQQYQPQPQYQK